jgi:PKD repeat protein
MNIIRYTSFLILALCVLAPGIIHAQGQINLSKTAKMSELPFIIIRPNGQIMVAWTEGGHFNGGGAVTYRTWTQGSGWTPMRQVAEATSAFPQLALDSAGNIHMAYWEGNSSYNRDIYYRKFVNGTWTAKQLVFDSWGYNSSWQRINVEGNRISILWCHNYAKPTPQDVVLIEKTDGATFPGGYINVSRTNKSTSIHPFLKVKGGNVYAAWMDDKHGFSNWNIYYAERRGGAWSSPVRVNPSGNQYCPAVEVDNQGNVHLIYSGRGGPIYYQKKTGNSWSSPKIISTAGTSITTFNFMKFAGGLLHALWRERDGEGNYIYYCQGTVDGNWSIPIKVSHGGQSEYPGLDIDKQGRVHVVYSDIGVGGERDIFYVTTDQVTSYPVALFDATPKEGRAPLNVIFDAQPSYDPDGSITSYQWKFGDGSTGTGVRASHTYSKNGRYTVTLTVTDDEKNSSESSLTITVGIPPVARLQASPQSGNSPLTVNFDGSDSYDADGIITSYKWDFGDGTSGSGQTVNHTYTNLATRLATLTVRDNEGLEASASVEIKISTGPIARFACNPKKGTAPLKVSFNAQNSKPGNKQSGKIVSYEWNFGDGSKGAGRNPTHTYRKTGIFTAILKITDNDGQVDSTTKEIVIFSKPTAKFTLSPTSGIAPLTVNFNASASNDIDGRIISYKWTFGDGITGTGKTISHTYSKGGTITIWLTVTDNDGYTNVTSNKITVIERPYPPKNFGVTNIVHEGLYFANYMNILRWKKNDMNTGKIQVVQHLIFRKKKGSSKFIWVANVGADVFQWEDRTLKSAEEMQSYIYGIRTADAYGRESDMKTRDAGK